MAEKNSKVAPIPRGYRSVTPHITTSDIDAAIELYRSAFDATVVSTETVPNSDIVLFAQVKIGNSLMTIGRGDAFGPGVVSLHHYVEDADAVWTSALAAGFTEVSALAETYWGDRMGLLVDPIGVRWSIGQRVLRLSPDEREQRAMAALGCADQPVPASEEQELAEDLNSPEVQAIH